MGKPSEADQTKKEWAISPLFLTKLRGVDFREVFPIASWHILRLKPRVFPFRNGDMGEVSAP